MYETITQLITPVIMAVVYSVILASKKMGGGQEFDMTKLATTMIYGLFVGIVCILGNVDVTMNSIEAQSAMLASLGFTVVMAQNLVEAAYRWFTKISAGQ